MSVFLADVALIAATAAVNVTARCEIGESLGKMPSGAQPKSFPITCTLPFGGQLGSSSPSADFPNAATNQPEASKVGCAGRTLQPHSVPRRLRTNTQRHRPPHGRQLRVASPCPRLLGAECVPPTHVPRTRTQEAPACTSSLHVPHGGLLSPE